MIRIIIPTYNRRDLVRRAVSSALRQAVGPVELLLVDDGSSDGTAEVLEGLAAAHREVRVIRLSHGGVAAARNAALDAPGEYEYIAYLDSDDEWQPGHLAAALDSLRADGSLVGTFSLPAIYDTEGRLLKAADREQTARLLLGLAVRARGQVHVLDTPRFWRMQLRGDFTPAPSTVVLRASRAGDLRFTRRFILEDCEYLLTLAARGPFAFVDEGRVKMHRLGDNLTGDAPPASDIALERWRWVEDYEAWKLPQAAAREDRRAIERKVALARYMIGQGLADRGDLAGARRAYRASLTTRPGALAAKGLLASCLPRAVRRALKGRRDSR